jgi:predicted nuclease with TOPRIM domain
MAIKSISENKEELRISEKGELIVWKNQLEQTVGHLSEEIERLSITNEQLIQDLKTRTFFNKYHEAMEELNELKLQQEMLIDYKFDNFQAHKTRQNPSLSVANIKRPFVDQSGDESNFKTIRNTTQDQITTRTVKSDVALPKFNGENLNKR